MLRAPIVEINADIFLQAAGCNVFAHHYEPKKYSNFKINSFISPVDISYGSHGILRVVGGLLHLFAAEPELRKN